MEKILLVTGASSEVGTALVKEIYGDYDRIYLQYRTRNRELDELCSFLEGKTVVGQIQADLAEDGAAEYVVGRIADCGKIPNHIVHLPAPKAYNKKFHKDIYKSFELGWKISVRSIVEILRFCIPAMGKSGYGRIVFMLTSCTLNHPPKYQSSYVTVKYALLGLMKSLAVEYADKGITVNGVSPDMMETKFLSDVPELIIRQNAENSPLKRNIDIKEVLPVMKYMLSDEGAAMTGQNIGITGGL